jgi:hypothetical protein
MNNFCYFFLSSKFEFGLVKLQICRPKGLIHVGQKFEARTGNIVESGIKHHNSPSLYFSLFLQIKAALIYLKIELNQI